MALQKGEQHFRLCGESEIFRRRQQAALDRYNAAALIKRKMTLLSHSSARGQEPAGRSPPVDHD
ncbi:hypothetical protein FG99_23465 [Pseudomonas sp. AAC]|nr:hypothetical protein FG99_23465 [Pseudomonas sp. AAC]